MRNLRVFVLITCMLLIFIGCQDKGKDKEADTVTDQETSSTSEDTSATIDSKTSEAETIEKIDTKENISTVESSETTMAESKTTETIRFYARTYVNCWELRALLI